ncbi:MAG: hypothetical protein R3B37_11205 [Nitrospira sp.]|nr:hypothetical protein [Nitrospira sp.]
MATHTFVADRINLNNAIVIDWDRGEKSSVPAAIDNSNGTFTTDDLTVTVFHYWRDANGKLQSSLSLRHQSAPEKPDWPGCFQPEEAVLWTKNQGPDDGPICIKFQKPVSAAGAQIQILGSGPFTGTLTVYDSTGQEVEKFSQPCQSSSAGDDSATFLGVEGADIGCIEFNTQDRHPTGFAINRLSIVR